MAHPTRTLLLPALTLAAAAAILVGERRFPLRRQTQAEPSRIARNLVLGALSMAVVSIVEGPVVRPLARQAEARRRGIAQRLPAPSWLRDAAAFLAMDYTIYLWHILTHEVPALWRLHLVHHVDLDMDATTALRFHAADMLVSVPYRAAQVALLGVSPRALQGWQAFFFLSVLFHHSNLRLPPGLERRLSRVLTTPRMHGIHHSTVRGETDSNWSSGLSLWDHLHRTFRLDVPDRRVQVGVAGLPRPLRNPAAPLARHALHASARRLAAPTRPPRPHLNGNGRGGFGVAPAWEDLHADTPRTQPRPAPAY